jgi:hypothetical protein
MRCLVCRLCSSFMVPGRPLEFRGLYPQEGVNVLLAGALKLRGVPTREAVLRLAGNTAAPDKFGKQGYMEQDAKAR